MTPDETRLPVAHSCPTELCGKALVQRRSPGGRPRITGLFDEEAGIFFRPIYRNRTAVWMQEPALERLPRRAVYSRIASWRTVFLIAEQKENCLLTAAFLATSLVFQGFLLESFSSNAVSDIHTR